MGFNIPVTSPQQDIIESGGYTGRDYILLCPNDIVFRCKPSSITAADVIAEFNYNTVSIGAFGDVKVDQTILITTGTSTAEMKRPLWRGRVRELPTSSVLYINESSIALDTAYYVTVIDTYDAVQRLRKDTKYDWNRTPGRLKPAIAGLSSSYVKEPVAGSAQFEFAPIYQLMEEGATGGGTWLWNIPGATYDVGSTTTQNVTVTLPTGHVWATVTATDSNGSVGKFVFEIYVQDRYSGAYIYAGAEGADITKDWDNGVNASVRYFEGVEDILDRTRVTIVTFEQNKDGDAEFPNVSFVGYLRQDDSETRADQNYGNLKERSFTIAGFNSLMGEIKTSEITAFDKAAPVLADEMKYPNAARVIHHLMTNYSTMGILAAVDYSGVQSNDHYGGDVDVESAYLMDACRTLAEEIHALVHFAADGQIAVRINACFLSTADRNALDTIMNINTGVMSLVGYNHAPLPRLAQIVAGFASYRTADRSRILYRGTAPAVAFDEGPDFDEYPGFLLTANATDTEARAEAVEQVAHLFAYNNDADEWTFALDGSFRFMEVSSFQWWTAVVPASDMSNGLGLTEDDRLLLKSMSHRFNPERGTREVRVTFRRETVGGLAMILVEQLPEGKYLQPRPPMPAYMGAFDPPGTLNYSSADSTPLPFEGNRFVASPNLPSDFAGPGRSVYVVSMQTGTEIATDFITEVSTIYRIRVRGQGILSPETPQSTPVAGGPDCAYGTTAVPSSIAHVSGTEWDITSSLDVPASSYLFNIKDIEDRSFLYNIVSGFSVFTSSTMNINSGPPVCHSSGVGGGAIDQNQALTALMLAHAGGAPDTIRINFYGNSASDLVMGDAFWHRYNSEVGGIPSDYDTGEGLLINGINPPDLPHYSRTHSYETFVVGDGLPITFQYIDPDGDYSNNSGNIYVSVEGPGAGV